MLGKFVYGFALAAGLLGLPAAVRAAELAVEAAGEAIAADAPAWVEVANAPLEHSVGLEYGWCGREWLGKSLCPPRQRWSAAIDMVMLSRTNSNDLEIFRDTASGRELLNADDLSFNAELGPRFRFLAPLAEGTSLEFSIFKVDGFRTQAVHEGPVELRLPGVEEDGNFAAATSPLIDYRSEICSQELNFRYAMNARLTALVGFRALQLEEKFNAASFMTRIYDSDTDNRLYGGQVGLDYQLAAGRRIELNAFIKAGVYRNDALAETLDPSGLFAVTPENRSLRANAGETAFAGEAGLIGSIRFWDFVFLRGGYQIMHVEAVALAPEQLPQNDFTLPANPLESTSGIDTSGQVFYHGAVAGLEVRW
jgi:hypothetical protein